MTSKKTVDQYIAEREGWQSAVLSRVRELILKTSPEVTESIKWAQPVFEVNGPMIFLRAFKNHINFGFWRGAELDDPEGLLQGSGEKMRHIKLAGEEDVQEAAFVKFIQQAETLNRTKGDPTRGK